MSRASVIPQFQSNVRLRHRYRFTSTSGTATSITPTSLLCAAGTICTDTNVLVVSAFQSVKVRRVEIWSPPAAQGDSVTCSVEWTGFQNSPNVEHSDTSVSVAVPAHVSCSPPRNSLASFWQVASTTGLFVITAPTGSVIDVVLDLVMSDDESPAANAAVTTATINLSYYLSLDPNSTHRFVPVSLITTT
jgi:hypothetical protein